MPSPLNYKAMTQFLFFFNSLQSLWSSPATDLGIAICVVSEKKQERSQCWVPSTHLLGWMGSQSERSLWHTELEARSWESPGTQIAIVKLQLQLRHCQLSTLDRVCDAKGKQMAVQEGFHTMLCSCNGHSHHGGIQEECSWQGLEKGVGGKYGVIEFSCMNWIFKEI